jgi:hypothetical protein
MSARAKSAVKARNTPVAHRWARRGRDLARSRPKTKSTRSGAIRPGVDEGRGAEYLVSRSREPWQAPRDV